MILGGKVMVKNLSIGRYIETNSSIHQLDPRVKLFGVIVFVTLLVRTISWQQYVALILYTFLIIFLTKIPIIIFLKGIRPLLRIIIFTAVLQILFTRGANIYFQWGPFTISEAGIRGAGEVFIRFSLVLMLTSAVGLSTKPLDLTAGLEKLLVPLKMIGLKVQDLALMMSIALRFIPTLFDESSRLKKAQESRGVFFAEGHFLGRMKKFLPLFIPVFVGSFYRAQELANALDVRGYMGKGKRTTFKIMRISFKDFVFASSLVALVVISLIFRG